MPEAFDKTGQGLAGERLSAGQPDFIDAQLAQHSAEVYNFFVGKQLFPRRKVDSFLRHAVTTAQIAAVGYGKAEVGGLAVMFVF